MQNQAKYTLQLEPVHFPDSFPLLLHDHRDHPAREILRLHRHDCVELGMCLAGEGVFVVEGKVMPFRSGDVSLIGPAEAHLAASSPGTTSHWIWYYLDFSRILLPHFPEFDAGFPARLRGAEFCNIMSGECAARLRRLLEPLAVADSSEAKSAWVLLLACELKNRFRDFPLPEEEPECSSFERIARAVSWFGRHYAEPLAVGEAAQLCGMSLSNFRRLFRRETGMAPLDYLNRLRICMAKAELRTGKYSISETAARCGFPSLSSFNRQFRKWEHASPREFRNEPQREAGARPAEDASAPL